MGVKASVAVIHVAFDSSNVVSGSTVTGKAYLAVNQSSVSCMSIGCRVIGREKTAVTYTVTVRHGDSVHTERRTAHEQRNFMDLKFCLAQIPNSEIVRGQYEYPFQFTIPHGAPASMNAGTGSDHCGISYTMEVWLDRPGMMRWDIRSHLNVIVTNPPVPGSKTPLYIEPGREPLHTLCCFHRGDILIGGSADSTVLSAGGQAVVKYAVSNNSTVNVKAVEVMITETINFSAQGHHHSENRILCQKRMSPQQARLDLAPLPSQKDGMGDGLSDLRALSHMLESDDFKLNFSIPWTARNSYNGSIIRVQHRFTIKIHTRFGTSNPSVWREVRMFSQALQNDPRQSTQAAQVPALPADWKPSVAEVVQLPSMALTTKAAVFVAEDDNKPHAYTGASAPTSTDNYSNFEAFIEEAKQTYDPCGELEKFLRNNQANDLTAEQFYALFKAINDVFDQQRCADILADALTEVTCVKVGRALAGTKDMCKREVAEKLLACGPVLDKMENAGLVKTELSAFQFMTVEKR